MKRTRKASCKRISRRMVCIVCLFLPLCAVFSACTPAVPVQDGRLQVVCALFAPYDFTRVIAGDLVQLTLLLQPGVESHRFAPTPADIIRLQSCDIFIRVDPQMELWSQPLLDSLDETPRILTLSQAIGVTVEEHHEHEHGQEHDAQCAQADPHLWTDPVYARQMTQAIAECLEQADPANAQTYRRNAQAYMQQLSQLDRDFQTAAQGGTRRLLVFGSSFAMRNFTQRYGLEALAALDSCGEHAEPGARVVADITRLLRGQHIPVVLKQEMVGGRVAQSIALETGARVLELHSCHNVTKEQWRAGESYLSLMRRNVQTLREALA